MHVKETQPVGVQYVFFFFFNSNWLWGQKYEAQSQQNEFLSDEDEWKRLFYTLTTLFFLIYQVARIALMEPSESGIHKRKILGAATCRRGITAISIALVA